MLNRCRPWDPVKRLTRILLTMFIGMGVTSETASVEWQRFLQEPANITARIGDTVMLPCQVHAAVGDLQWTCDEFGLGVGRVLPVWPRYGIVGDEAAGFFSLQIVDVRLQDDGVYQCQAGATPDQPGIRSRNAHLSVLVPPVTLSIVQGEQLTVTSGAVIRLQCESRGGKPLPELEWFDVDGEPLENITSTHRLMSDSKRFVVESSMLLAPETRHHGGTITCRMNSVAMKKPRSVGLRLRVRFPPVVTMRQDSVQVSEYGRVVVHCSATANPDYKLSYKWLVDDEVMVGDHGTELRLESVGREMNQATVICQVSNDVGTGNQSLQLDIRYSPQFRTEPRDVSAEMGEQATLACDVDGNPTPEIRWVKKDCENCQKIIGLGGEVTLPVGLDTVGVYECRAAATGFAEVSRQVLLQLRSHPRVSAISPQSALLGQRASVECLVESVPLPTSSNWYMYGHSLDAEVSRFSIVDEPIAGGIRSRLVISSVEQGDFGVYNCSFRNQYGLHSAMVVLQQHDSMHILLIMCGIAGALILVGALTLWLVFRRRNHRTAPGHRPGGGIEKRSSPSEHDSTDLRLDSSSSVSGRTGSYRSSTIALALPNNLLHQRHYGSAYMEMSRPERRYSPLDGREMQSQILPRYDETLPYGGDPRFSALYGNPYLKSDTTLSRLPPPPSYRSSTQLATHV